MCYVAQRFLEKSGSILSSSRIEIPHHNASLGTLSVGRHFHLSIGFHVSEGFHQFTRKCLRGVVRAQSVLMRSLKPRANSKAWDSNWAVQTDDGFAAANHKPHQYASFLIWAFMCSESDLDPLQFTQVSRRLTQTLTCSTRITDNKCKQNVLTLSRIVVSSRLLHI